MEEGLIDPEKSVQIGMRGSLYDPDDFKIAADLGFTVIPGDKLHTYSPEDLLKVIKEKVGDNKVFLTFDIDFVDPETGKTVGVDACFEEVDGKWQEIGKRKWYVLRKKHGERLAAILRAKED